VFKYIAAYLILAADTICVGKHEYVF